MIGKEFELQDFP